MPKSYGRSSPWRINGDTQMLTRTGCTFMEASQVSIWWEGINLCQCCQILCWTVLFCTVEKGVAFHQSFIDAGWKWAKWDGWSYREGRICWRPRIWQWRQGFRPLLYLVKLIWARHSPWQWNECVKQAPILSWPHDLGNSSLKCYLSNRESAHLTLDDEWEQQRSDTDMMFINGGALGVYVVRGNKLTQTWCSSMVVL